MLEHLPVSGTETIEDMEDGYQGETYANQLRLTYTEDAYYQDCLERKSMACSSFTRDNDGFSATFEGDRERLVFFSVPYESGWSATVNGEPAEVEKVSVGFMAVKVPAGKSEIRFDYTTPGLSMGAVITLLSAVLLGLYLFLTKRYDKAAKKHWKRVYRVKNPELLSSFRR